MILIVVFATNTLETLGQVESYKLHISDVYINGGWYRSASILKCVEKEELHVKVYITNDNEIAANCNLTISTIEGECLFLPRSCFNLTIPPGHQSLWVWESGKETVTFVIIPSKCGKLFLELDLIYDEKIVDSFPINIEVKPPSIYISHSTSLDPNPAFQNETCKLEVVVKNEENLPFPIFINAYKEDLNLTLIGQKNITVPSGYISVTFAFVTPNITGTFSIIIELWYQGKKIDEFSTVLKVVQQEVLFMPQEIWIVPLILIAVLTVVTRKFLGFNKSKSLILGLMTGCFAIIAVLIFYWLKLSQRTKILQYSYLYTYLITHINYIEVCFSLTFLLISSAISYKITRKLKKSLLIGIIAAGTTSIIYDLVISQGINWSQFIVKWSVPLTLTALFAIITLTGVIAVKRNRARRLQIEGSLLHIAKYYGGILTASQVSMEDKNISIKQARRYLDSLVKMGEARKMEIGGLIAYDIPSIRNRMSIIERALIEILIENGGRLSKNEYLRLAKIDPKTFIKTIKELEKVQIITYDPKTDQYAFKLLKMAQLCPYCGRQLTEDELEKLRKGRDIKCKCGMFIGPEDIAKAK